MCMLTPSLIAHCSCLLASIFSFPSQLRSGEHGAVGRKREDFLGLSSSSWVAFSQCGYSSREPKSTGVCRAEELLPSGNWKPSHTFTRDTELSDPVRWWLRHPNTLSWRKPWHTHSALSRRKPWQYSHGALSRRRLWQHSHSALSGITDAQRRLLIPSILPIHAFHADDRPPHPTILHRHLQVLGFPPRCHSRHHRLLGHRRRSLRPRLCRHLRQQPQLDRRVDQLQDRRVRRSHPRGNRRLPQLHGQQQVPLHHPAGEVRFRRCHHLRRHRRYAGRHLRASQRGEVQVLGSVPDELL